MAVFIRKERLGSGPAPKVERKSFRKGVKFGVMAEAFEKAKEKKAQELEDKYESNAEVQQWRRMTREEQVRSAIDRMTPTGMAIESMRQGKEVTEEVGRKYAERIASKAERKKNGE